MNASSIHIVAIAERHIPGFQVCLDEVAREQRYLAMTEAPPLGAVEQFVKAGIAHGVVQFVALNGETVVGWADVLPAWGQAVVHCGRLGMGVLEGYRGRGIGKRLLLACLEQARARGFTRIELEARADNIPAIALYEQFAFVREALKHRGMRFAGQYYDTVQMSLLFADD